MFNCRLYQRVFQNCALKRSVQLRELIKTLSLMERKHQIRFEDDGSLCLDQKKKHEITLKGVFRAGWRRVDEGGLIF